MSQFGVKEFTLIENLRDSLETCKFLLRCPSHLNFFRIAENSISDITSKFQPFMTSKASAMVHQHWVLKTKIVSFFLLLF
jgi:hypothetical protein